MTIAVPTAREDGTVSTIERRLAKVFPEGSYFLKNPEGTNAKSNQLVSTFRTDWAKQQKTTVEQYMKRAADKQTVAVKANYDVGTIKKNLCQALGIPPAALVIQKPSGEVSKDNIKLSTFRGYWAGKS